MPQSEIKRLFLAIPLPESVQATLASWQLELQRTGADVKWVEPHNLHITLNFLGDTPVDKIPDILRELKKILGGQKNFSVTLDRLGAFPSQNAPKIIWLGSREKTPLISEIVDKIDTALSSLGFKKEERVFTTHATLGRVRLPYNKTALIEKMSQMQPRIMPQTFAADSIILMESRLEPKGPLYIPIEKFDLI